MSRDKMDCKKGKKDNKSKGQQICEGTKNQNKDCKKSSMPE